jgi:hypothetical protein
MALQDVSSASERRCGHGIPSGSSDQTHVGVGVREHVKRLEWKTRYDESAKLFDENLQNS